MKIIIPTDLSIESEKAIRNLVPLLLNRKAEVSLFHCVEPPLSTSSMMINISDILISNAREKMTQFKQMLKDKGEDSVTVEHHISFGSFPKQMEQFVSSSNPDLVIVPSNKKSMLERIFVGQRALDFIGEWDVPTLITPFDRMQRTSVKIGLALDQQEGTSEAVGKKLEKIRTFFDAEVVQFHIDDFSESSFDYYMDKERFGNESGSVAIVQDVHIESGINRWCKREEVSMLAMVTHNKNFFHKNFVHSTIRELVKANELSILVLTKEN